MRAEGDAMHCGWAERGAGAADVPDPEPKYIIKYERKSTKPPDKPEDRSVVDSKRRLQTYAEAARAVFSAWRTALLAGLSCV